MAHAHSPAPGSAQLTEDDSKFQHHVSFDNFSGGKATEKNSISFTLNSKHTGYKYQRRSRTFMVGIDENEYSDVALKWMLEELVDDGDEIICLRVIEKDAKIINDKNLERRQYQKAAKEMMLNIQSMNEAHRAISIVLEFAVGELHSTFQQMVSSSKVGGFITNVSRFNSTNLRC